MTSGNVHQLHRAALCLASLQAAGPQSPVHVLVHVAQSDAVEMSYNLALYSVAHLLQKLVCHDDDYRG